VALNATYLAAAVAAAGSGKIDCRASVDGSDISEPAQQAKNIEICCAPTAPWLCEIGDDLAAKPSIKITIAHVRGPRASPRQ
jgi:hypothetical protein